MRSKSCPGKSPSREREPSALLAAPGAEQNGAFQALIGGLRGAGYRVAALDLDPLASDEDLEDRYLETLASAGAADVIGGFSLGARIAARIAGRSGARALVALSYPFHRRGAPAQTHGLDSLRGLALPTLIVQGARDAHGSRSELRSYGPLPTCVELHFLEDANHQLVPRQRSPFTLAGHRQETAAIVLDFLRRSLVSTPS